MTRRLTSRSLAGTWRKLVAVGTPRLASMLATIRAPAPRSGSPTGAAGAARPAPPRRGAGAVPAAAAAGAAVASPDGRRPAGSASRR